MTNRISRTPFHGGSRRRRCWIRSFRRPLGRVQNPAARPALLMQKKLSDSDLVKELYLWSVARHARPEELKVGLDFLGSYGDRKLEAAQDLMWALLNSRDFLLLP